MAAEDILIPVIVFMIAVVMQGTILIFLVWLLRKRQIWSLMMFGLKGGSLALKGHLNNEIEIIHSKNAITQVPWKVVERATGQKKTIYQPIKRVWHTLKGTSYPIHLCPFTNVTNISMMARESATLNTEEINSLMVRQYSQGFSDATSFKTVAGFPIDKATLVMLLLVGVVCVILLAVNVQILGVVSPQ